MLHLFDFLAYWFGHDVARHILSYLCVGKTLVWKSLFFHVTRSIHEQIETSSVKDYSNESRYYYSELLRPDAGRTGYSWYWMDGIIYKSSISRYLESDEMGIIKRIRQKIARVKNGEWEPVRFKITRQK